MLKQFCTFDKPRIKKPLVYFKLAFSALFLILCIVSVVLTLLYAHRYTSAASAPMELDAQIIRVKANTSEDSVTYDAIMRYRCNGMEYEAVYASFGSEADANALIGQEVTAIVDAIHPGDTLDHLQDTSEGWLLAADVFALCLVFALAVPHRQSYVDTYGWCVESVSVDLLVSPPYYVSLLLAWVPCYLIIVLCCPNVFLCGNGWFAHAFLPCAYVIAGSVALIIGLRNRYLIKNCAVTLRRDTCVRKWRSSDGEAGYDYFVTVTNGKRTWKTRVSEAQYSLIAPGDAVQTAYLGNRKEPNMHHFGIFEQAQPPQDGI